MSRPAGRRPMRPCLAALAAAALCATPSRGIADAAAPPWIAHAVGQFGGAIRAMAVNVFAAGYVEVRRGAGDTSSDGAVLVVDVRNADAPRVVGRLANGGGSGLRDGVAVHGGRVYLAAGEGGMWVFEPPLDRSQPRGRMGLAMPWLGVRVGDLRRSRAQVVPYGCMNIIHAVNNIDSPTYRPRWIEPALRDASREHPVVVLTGARQVGKSTVLQHAPPFRAWRYHSLDDLDVLAQARDDPAGLWAGTDAVVLDEVQRAPAVLHAVKLAVDGDRRRRFVLSGSANLLLMQHVSESLAGRAITFHLGPMTVGEIAGVPPPTVLSDALAGTWPLESVGRSADPMPWLLGGLMPALLTVPTPEGKLRWWDGYVRTYLERDLRQMAQIADLVDFRRLMTLLALRCGQLLNQSDVGRDAGLSQPTAHRYINLLETAHLIQRLPAYAGSRTTQLVKAPRVFWSDPALAVFLAGYYDLDSLRAGREVGGFFEALVLVHLTALAELLIPRARLSFWRTRATGAEVDFVVTHGRRQLAVEVKLTERPGVKHAAGLQRFIEAHPGANGLLVHAGGGIVRLAERIMAVPWTALGGVDAASLP